MVDGTGLLVGFVSAAVSGFLVGFFIAMGIC